MHRIASLTYQFLLSIAVVVKGQKQHLGATDRIHPTPYESKLSDSAVYISFYIGKNVFMRYSLLHVVIFREEFRG